MDTFVIRLSGAAEVNMTHRLSEFLEHIKSKRVAVAGLDDWNRPLVEYLGRMGIKVTVFDRRSLRDLEDITERIGDYDIDFNLGPDCFDKLSDYDIIFISPHSMSDTPELLEAQKNGAVLTTEIEVFMDLCPAEIIAVTGSCGTAATMETIYTILKEAGHGCHTFGADETSLLAVIGQIKTEDKIVLELKSCQLPYLKKSPNVAVITSLSQKPDKNLSLEEYMNAIKNIFRYQDESGLLVLNFDDPVSRELKYEAPSKIVYFSKTSEPEAGTFMKGNTLYYKENEEIQEIIKDIRPTDGLGIEKYLAAIAATRRYADPSAVYKALKKLAGTEPGIPFVKEVRKVKYYCDSDLKSPNHIIEALDSFDQRLILITTGTGKLPYEVLGQAMAEKVKHLILVGQTASQLETALMRKLTGKYRGIDIRITHCSTLKQAVDCADLSAKPGDIVLLSPLGSDPDMSGSYEELENKYRGYIADIDAI